MLVPNIPRALVRWKNGYKADYTALQESKISFEHCKGTEGF